MNTTVTREDRTNAWADENGVKYSADRRRLLRAADGVQECVVADGCQVICDGAFAWCGSLADVILPDSIVAVGRGVFDGCASLATIRIPAGTKSRFEAMLPDRKALLVEGLSTAVQADDMRNPWTDGRGVKYSADKRRLLHAPQDLDYYSVAEGCQIICDGAFDWCEALKSIFLPASVEAIPKNVFDDCENLNEIFIPDGTRRQFEILLPAKKGLLKIFTFENRYNVSAQDLANAWVDEFGVKYSPCYLRLLKVPEDLVRYVIKESCKIICNGAFEGCTKLTSIEIPSSVTSIGQWAFYGCAGLTSIEIPDSVTGIGAGAFSGCSSLESITLPFVGDKPHTATDTYQCPFGYIFGTDSYTGGIATEQFYYGDSTISSATYYIPSSLKSVKITGSSHIPFRAFDGCTGLTSIEIPSGVTSIGDYAFRGCTGLTNIEIPNRVTSIGEFAFSGCSSLESITLPFVGYNPHTATDTYQYPFGYIFGTDSYTGGTATSQIYSQTYYNGSTSTSATYYIPSSLKSVKITGSSYIPYGAFLNCTGLTSIEIPSSVTSIGDSAFEDCTGLTSIEIPSSVTSIGDSAFDGTAWYNNQPDGLVYVGKVAYKYKGTMPDNTNIVLADDTLGIADWAFKGCTGLTSIEIGDGVTSIGDYAFRGCTGLTSIKIPSSVTSIGDWAFSGCKGLTSIEIPDSVTSIGGSAFWGCKGLTSIEIPSSVTEIGDRAFYGCDGLTHIDIPSGVTEIGNDAFNGCIGLTSIDIPSGVTSIGHEAFSGCTGLTSVEIPSSVTSIGEGAFSGCTGLASLEIPDSVTSIGDYAFSLVKNVIYTGGSTGSPWKALAVNGFVDGDFVFTDAEKTQLAAYIGKGSKIVIPISVTSIGSRAFWCCSGLTSLEIPSSVTSVGGNAFGHCSGLKSIVVASGNGVYDSRNNCNAIIETASNTLIAGCQNTIIPTGVTSIGKSAFSGCTGLTSIEIPSGVPSIGSWAFSGCTGLTHIEIPDSVTEIGDSAFSGCTGLTHIKIPSGVTSIGYSAFNGCTGLTSIKIPSSVTSIGIWAFYGCTSLAAIYIPKGSSEKFERLLSGYKSGYKAKLVEW